MLLRQRLREAAIRLNPDVPEATVDAALTQLADRRQAMSLVAANREVDNLLRDGIPVVFEDPQGQPQQKKLRLIDFGRNGAKTNQFLAVTQLWIKCTSPRPRQDPGRRHGGHACR